MGHEKANYDKIYELLELAEIKSDELVLCGDTFDLWRYPVTEIDETIMPEFKKCLDKLKEAAKEIPIKIIPGNHDYNLQNAWKDLQKDYNVEISDNFYRGDIYFTHGWQFDVRQRRFSFAYSWLVTQFPYLYQRYFKKPAQMGIKKRDKPYEMSDKVHIEAENFALKNNLKYVVLGHTHIPTICNHIIDCGDFIDSCSYIELDNKEPKMRFI